MSLLDTNLPWRASAQSDGPSVAPRSSPPPGVQESRAALDFPRAESAPAGRRGDPARPRASARSPSSILLAQHLAAMAGGQHQALALCYDAIGPAVYSLAVRMLRDRQAAEDVTQDIFVQVWRQAANYDPARGSPEAWIMMIGRTRILDRLRSRQAGIVLKPFGDNLPDLPDVEEWPEELAISREAALHVRLALRQLPPDQRQAIELAFFEGLTHMEIAAQMGVPLGTIKTRIRLGLIKIRDRLHPPVAAS